MQATTIVALSTPPGRSGIGVIRISGTSALALTRSLLQDENFNPEPQRASLRPLREPNGGDILDHALVTYFKSPHSFTGEDIVELSCHGSPPLLLTIIDTLLYLGARTADPGEFTMRGLINGRLNLTQAEAIRDLIDAQTHAAVRQAARQLGGELSARLQPLKSSLLDVIVPLESSLEFVEDDLPQDISELVSHKLLVLANTLKALADTFRKGRLLKEGLRVTFAGRPNVGKSSLFNSLLQSERAIVTDIPGTTRDTLSEVIDIKGIPVLITDTAGVRTSSDRIEQLGVERTQRAIVDADMIVVVIDGSQPLGVEDLRVIEDAAQSRFIIALNKNDLPVNDLESIHELSNSAPISSVSAKTGSGLDSLCTAIIEPFSANEIFESNFIITNARHYDLLCRTENAILSSQNLLSRHASEELVLVGLYDALRFLGNVTGETTPEDVLTQIFSTFCIGK
ncbi:MAG: tRNA uridine-5-carboxymethylaminomethyl(34) synthesis GTPase MnmE [Acidobacteria bacterium]|nr:tRNA uridine-5-carboxymethylaminomethyl(34) synthesis GTPase MnmE [Acidobacteriota bacterium]